MILHLNSLNSKSLNLDATELAIECGIEPRSPDRWSLKSWMTWRGQSEKEV
ncbi:MAG: hypothetical protein WBQ64_04140 [Terriglobales bacterium]